MAAGGWVRGGCRYFKVPILLITIKLERSEGAGHVRQAASQKKGPGLETGTLKAPPLSIVANAVCGLLFTWSHLRLSGDAEV